jgi:hypothetical protein
MRLAWGVVGLLLILWFLGIALQIAGSLIHFVLLAALVILIINLLTSSGRSNVATGRNQ